MGKLLKRLWEKNKILTILTFLFILIFLSAFGTKIFLYATFLLGNDIMVKLKADKEALFMTKGDEELIEFEASVTTNPFCKAECTYVFKDISQDFDVDKADFVLRPGNPLKKEYSISVTRTGKGQDLYRFDIECKSVGNLLCHTKEEVTTRSILVTINYDLNEYDEILKNDLKGRLLIQKEELETSLQKQKSIEEALHSLNNTLVVSEFEGSLVSIGEFTNHVISEMNTFSEFFKESKYDIISQAIDALESDVKMTQYNVQALERDLAILLERYNKVVGDSNSAKEGLSSISATEDTVDEMNNTIIDFNRALITLNQRNRIEAKEQAILQINEKIAALGNRINLSNGTKTNLTFENIGEIYLGLVELNQAGYQHLNMTLDEPEPRCCVFGECNKCCVTDECRNDPNTFPVMLLHGHAVSKGVSAEYSLEGFNHIQKELEKDGYLNTGAITLYSPKDTEPGIWGFSGAPLTIRTSYYFDIFKEPENYKVVQTKSESIDTYAVRLKELIDTVKYRTGKPKVNLMAFSMGGLVARRYMQLFGTDDIDKVILIGTPNKGTTGDVSKVCPLFGAKHECRDLNEGSLFLNKLNYGEKPDIPITMVLGTGCDMAGEQGDGIVLEDHARLEGAENHVINGVCRGKFQPLHLDLLKVERYPEVYGIILEKLEE